MFSDEEKQLLRARRFAMEVSLKFAMRKQAEKKQKKQAQQLQRQVFRKFLDIQVL